MAQQIEQPVLLVEDDASSREGTKLLLEDVGFSVFTAEDGAQAMRKLSDGASVVVTDLKLPRLDGMQLLRAVREHAPHVPVIMITGRGSEEAAVDALKVGAFHYLTKPIDGDLLVRLVRQALEKSTTAQELAILQDGVKNHAHFHQLIGKCERMRKVFEQVHMVADTRSTVLIEGESGTGKELVARAIHAESARRNKPFVAINCAALPETLVESELFGHAKGAFTGAASKHTGKFASAEGGTLLIDEIGEMQMDLQSKLLRAIETRRITPIGSNEEIQTDVRIIASTHQKLQDLVDEGRFREDLFYRLNVVRIELPPLRELQGDIPLLVRAFIDEIASETGRDVHDISPEAMEKLQSYHWPGNVRQLRNVLESVIVMSTRETIDVVDLPEPIRAFSNSSPTLQSLISTGTSLIEIEKEVIYHALERTKGNRKEAGKLLGISSRTVQRRIKEYDLPF
jgi:DNA-binding NtrC family response regulator